MSLVSIFLFDNNYLAKQPTKRLFYACQIDKIAANFSPVQRSKCDGAELGDATQLSWCGLPKRSRHENSACFASCTSFVVMIRRKRKTKAVPSQWWLAKKSHATWGTREHFKSPTGKFVSVVVCIQWTCEVCLSPTPIVWIGRPLSLGHSDVYMSLMPPKWPRAFLTSFTSSYAVCYVLGFEGNLNLGCPENVSRIGVGPVCPKHIRTAPMTQIQEVGVSRDFLP